MTSGAVPMPPPHSSARRPSSGAREADAQRAQHPEGLARAQLAQPVRAGADVLEHEAAASPSAGPQRPRSARQERPLVLPRAPAARPRRACRTGPAPARARRGPAPRDDGRRRARRPLGRRRSRARRAERRPASPAPGGSRPPALARGAPAGERTSGSPCARARAIARAAASAARQRRQARDPARDRGAADLPAVGARARARRRVDDQVDVAALDPVDDVRRALAELVQRARPGRPCARSPRAVPRVARIRKPRSCSVWAIATRAGLVGVGDRDEDRAGLAAAARPRPPAPWRTPSGSRARRP